MNWNAISDKDRLVYVHEIPSNSTTGAIGLDSKVTKTNKLLVRDYRA